MTTGILAGTSFVMASMVLGQGEVFDASKLFVYGPLGVVLAWFMIRYEKRADKSDARMVALEGAMDRGTRAQLLMLIELPGICPQVKTQANAINKEIDSAEQDRAAIHKPQ